ncbi:carboxymuconolactone decarboxylase family protein (plasmid) [Aliirhizobium terrae]|uniref:carboxymuconolactone decarboxylase family protein n=1 Tax=Terrirhizobium terrae TaxID=2926709 RepID=UPI002578225E|nr:carboxymuconolactone decarboxylase family protein [Rhizobium sp. CC-CFT758]WJH37971.1 carboxymuconolactone decarboxylase family protein [Rhizobium sp. CC-CFT758]
MQPRFDINAVEPDSFKAIMGLEMYVQKSGIEKRYLSLVKIRTSQINGCAYCVDMHTKEAEKARFSNQWIALIAVWKESALFDEKERAVLNWAESMTNVSQTGIPDSDFDKMRKHFSNAEIAKLSTAIATINVWNRMALAIRLQHPIDHETTPAAA